MLTSADHSDFSLEGLLATKRETVSVCIPTRETATTIGATIEVLAQLREAGLLDEVIVVDADSADGTAAIAKAAGAEVFRENELLPQFGPARGKGDAMWRSLSVASGELVVYLDGDVHDFGAHYAIGLLGPLLGSPRLDFVKGFYRRPLAVDDVEIEDGGGRVTELTAKPLLELLAPELAAFRQPLAGECAARRSLLAQLPYCTGYGVEIAMLVEAWTRVGIGRMAQVGLGSKRNSHQPLAELAKMSREVIEALVAQTSADSASNHALGTIRAAQGWEARLEMRPPLCELADTSPGATGIATTAISREAWISR